MLFSVNSTNLWISAQKLWINNPNCGKHAHLFEYTPKSTPHIWGVLFGIPNLWLAPAGTTEQGFPQVESFAGLLHRQTRRKFALPPR
jgi:hypothetical protein